MPRAVSPSKAALGIFTPGYRSKWVDPSWTKDLSRLGKALYSQIIEQPSISRAGVLHLDPETLADQHADTDVDNIQRDLDELQHKSYVIVSGPWLFVRSWFKFNRSTRNINHLGPILRDIETIGRRDLREKVFSALATSLACAAAEGEKFAPEVITALDVFAEKWKLQVPPEIGKAVRKKR